jgi:hypothetical protein
MLGMGGAAVNSLGDKAGGYNTVGGSALKGLGTTGMLIGGGAMMLPEKLTKTGLERVSSSGEVLGTGTAGAALAGVAAIGAGSYAAGSYIGGKFSDDSVKSRGTSAAASALAGAGIGAAIGSFVPIIGTGIGAAIGAAIGGITGYMKAGKQRKETQKAAKALVDDFGTKIDDAISGGNVDDLMKARDQLLADKQKLISTNADPAYAAKAVAKYDAEFEKMNTKIDNYTGNAKLANDAFGISAESLNSLALKAGYDLTSKLYNFQEVLGFVAKTAEEKARLIKQAFANIGSGALGASMSYFDKQAQAREASKAVDAQQAKLLTGDTSIQTQQEFLKQSLLYNTSKYGDLGGMANTYTGLQDQFKPGGALAGLSPEVQKSMLGEVAKAGMDSSGILKNIDSAQLATLLGGSVDSFGLKGKDGQVDPGKMMQLISSKMSTDPAFLANLENAIKVGNGNTGLTNQLTGAVLNSGTVSGQYGTSNFNPGATTPSQTYGPTTVNVTGLINDPKTIRQIEEAVARAMRDKEERGGPTVTTGYRQL